MLYSKHISVLEFYFGTFHTKLSNPYSRDLALFDMSYLQTALKIIDLPCLYSRKVLNIG